MCTFAPLMKKNLKQRVMMLLLLCVPVASFAADNDSEARAVFEKAYNQVFGPEGCTLHYDVNLVGLYKTEGTIWYKGEKNKFIDTKADSWCDGKTMYTAYRKKKTVEIYDAHSEKADKYRNKFKFTLDDFTYSMEKKGDNLLLILKQKKGAKGTVKEAKALVDAKTLAPQSVRIKVLLFWANIKITNFKAGGLSDDIFVFPKNKYKDFNYVDKRGK